MDSNKICREALEVFGAEAQTIKLFEEMAELQKELCKVLNGEGELVAVAEEIADVEIVLQQMVILHDCSIAVKYYRDLKLERLADRIRDARERGGKTDGR